VQLFKNKKTKRRPKIEIIPMVDVMFLLLVFYILSSLALHAHRGVPVSLPKADTSQGGETNQELVVTIDEQGGYFIGQEKVEAEKLSGAIRVYASAHGGLETLGKNSITLNADLKTQHKNVVFAMDQLRQLGLDNFVIATGAPTAPTGAPTSQP
jgi:biopolymer transport protein ExbD